MQGPGDTHFGKWSFTGWSVCFVPARGLRNRGRRGRYYASRSHGEHNPKDDVSKYSRPGAQDGQEPENPHDRGIELKIVGQAGAHTRNLLICARAHQLPLAARLRREAWRGCFRLFGAAVVAKPRTDSDVFLAVYASHWVTPTGQSCLASLPVST